MKESRHDLRLMAALHPSSLPIREAVASGRGSCLVLVGPEGDFTEGEVELARGAGFRIVSLGRRVLRAETAAGALLSVLSYELGLLSPPGEGP